MPDSLVMRTLPPNPGGGSVKSVSGYRQTSWVNCCSAWKKALGPGEESQKVHGGFGITKTPSGLT